MARLDILLINPGNWSAIYGQVGKLSGIAPPLGLGLLAAFLREHGHSVAILDAEAENLSPERVAEIVRDSQVPVAGISAFTTKMRAAREILLFIKAKAPQVVTVIGGHHPAALPERVLREEVVDFVCHGEGFYPLLHLLDGLKHGGQSADLSIEGLCYKRNDDLVLGPRPPLLAKLDDLPFVAWDLLPMERYRAHNWHCFGYDTRSPYAVVFSSLGCPFHCTYCSVNVVYGRRSYRVRSPEHFVAEIDLLVRQFGVRHMEVADDTFTVDKERVHRICDLLIERDYDLNLWAYARTDTVDAELLAKMKRAGFNWVCYGFESGSELVRKGVRKEQRRIWDAVAMTKAAGINILSNFIFGLPNDDLSTMRQTLDLAKEINGEYANFYCAMAYPGSELFDLAVQNRWPLPQEWHDYSQYAYGTLPLPTECLTGPQVLKFRDEAFIEYFSHPPYLEKIRRKFGFEVEKAVEEMLKVGIKRKHVE